MSYVVAAPYVDQLERAKALAADRVASLRTAIDNADKGQGADRRTVLDELDQLAGQVETDAAKAPSRDQVRMKALASTIKARVKALR